ncbi:acyl carrier protein [Defluviimonas salinarum]|uniref:Acyl carrier protein n=1 Tax=Defluviimonas salinarum TaxID=2992147 RepID=A0ABT3J6J3_9RHOB|nr:acyl carrier protein [Defluviimonas salinarum]MCW3783278.1 acyl carrier protein [Defluviimonas salinarum]
MTSDPIEDLVRKELGRIAPDVDPGEIDRKGDLREECDIDSLDFLNLVTALGKALLLPMPEADYPKMRSYDALVAYLRTSRHAPDSDASPSS